MQEIMLSESPIEEREQILRDSCDKIEERYYVQKFNQAETTEKRKEYSDLSIQISELDQELQGIKAEYKGQMKPLEEMRTRIINEIKVGGEHIRGDVFKFMDQDEGKVAYYSPDGHKLEERDLRPDEKQRTIFQKNLSVGGSTESTGTNG